MEMFLAVFLIFNVMTGAQLGYVTVGEPSDKVTCEQVISDESEVLEFLGPRLKGVDFKVKGVCHQLQAQ